ncbi:hypothetical protein [Deinococcus sp.]|uniref:hypothetical protein n=1 Tax=Deinococcus sp. TaxID=47478 RepID=UPI0028698A67|nr:hypothetical protein [Deinococcus sp.]
MTPTKTAGMIAALSLSLLVACGGGSGPTPNPGSNPTSTVNFEAPDGLLHAPGRVGELKTIQVHGQPLTYEVIDGLAVYQGDMILGKAADVAAAALKGKGNTASEHLSAQAVICDWDNITTGWGWFCGRWSGGVVPYSIQAD